ncbi:NAD(P)-binding protein [Teratosphaeria nubilosa]|uniref:NAD(P)-binding protein n=1 Tax=Teratosphaeria nubilosa TaxID=161662 RepID=A0A6G1L5X6_9PEZI|nr:NAD(P)-binding protein [Teratosphaeria nubilosa]
MAPQVFFITGTSTGFGYELVKKCLSEGDKVVATARNSSKLKFDNTSKDNFLAVDCDVTDQKSIHDAFDKAISAFGRVDVVVNNAGYGLSGEFESLSDRQLRTQMEVNFFGLLNVTRRALEVMRDVNKPQGGKIQQITSIGGQRGVSTFSIYCASKWAVEGFTEALNQEIKPEWNIKLTCIEPGGFRTDWAGRSMIFGENKNPAYDHIDAKKTMGQRHGTQAGDPPKGARAMWEIAKMDDPPLRTVIGSDAYEAIMGKIKTYGELYPKYKDLANSTDVDGYKKPS